MTSFLDFTPPVKLRHVSTSTGWMSHQVVKSPSQKFFVNSPVKSFRGLRNSSENAQLTTIPAATDSDKATTEPSTTTDSSIAETKVTSTPPPLPIVQAEGAASTPVQNTATKRAPLSAREKLRAARVLSRYTESKPSKPRMGSKVLDALRDSDGGKRRSGLPQAPTNLFDDSKRGMPKKGLTFDLPGGADLFFIVLSFVLISTTMFATTYLVWKLGAIHFNEY